MKETENAAGEVDIETAAKVDIGPPKTGMHIEQTDIGFVPLPSEKKRQPKAYGRLRCCEQPFHNN